MPRTGCVQLRSGCNDALLHMIVLDNSVGARGVLQRESTFADLHRTRMPLISAVTPDQTIRWERDGVAQEAVWWSNNDRPAPTRVMVVDDRCTADEAIQAAAQGTAMLYLGDYHNAKQLLAAMDRRLSKPGKKPTKAPGTPAEEFYKIRQTRAQRSRMMSLVLVPLQVEAELSESGVPLSRSPHMGPALAFGYAEQHRGEEARAAVSLQELTGVLSAYQWYLNGVDVPSLGAKIHPHYGTFLPTRHEYVDLVARVPHPEVDLAFDIGTGTGVLAAVLIDRGIRRVVATDMYQRSVDCANDNFARLGIADVAHAERTNMFPEGRAPLVVCNPPWLPGSAATTLDAAVYDPGSAMLLQFLAGLPDHLTEGGEGWLLMSDLAELLGLRTRETLTDAIAAAGLEVIDRLDTLPNHKRATDRDDLLYEARSREVTSLYRLRVRT